MEEERAELPRRAAQGLLQGVQPVAGKIDRVAAGESVAGSEGRCVGVAKADPRKKNARSRRRAVSIHDVTRLHHALGLPRLRQIRVGSPKATLGEKGEAPALSRWGRQSRPSNR